jgi:hypothetical protein
MGGDGHLVEGNLSFAIGMHGDHGNHASQEESSHDAQPAHGH